MQRTVKPFVVIAGAGQTGRELAGRLAVNWRVVLVDRDPDKLARLGREAPQAEVRLVEGDATSALALRESEADRAHAVVACTGRDDVNYEVCRLARKRFDVPRVLAMVILRDQVRRFEELGVEAFSRSFSAASILQGRLERGKRTTAELGLGKGEIYEVTVLPHSPAIGKNLAELHPQAWLVGAIYRKGELVVPHGKTVIQEKDRVLLIGDPRILPAIADYFRSGTSEFPLQYGTRIVVANPADLPEGRLVDEAVYLARFTRAFGVTLLVGPRQSGETLAERCDRAEIECRVVNIQEGEWMVEHIEEVAAERDCGCLVLPPPRSGLLARLGLGNPELDRVLDGVRVPVLISRGTYPYRRMLLAMSAGDGPTRAAELALDVARLLGAHLRAVTSFPPSFVGGKIQNAELEEALRHAVILGGYYTYKVESEALEGNPVHRIAEEAAGYDLLVMAHRQKRYFTLARPDISWHLLLRAPCSVLLLPYGRESG